MSTCAECDEPINGPYAYLCDECKDYFSSLDSQDDES